jgi:hypothetical protein
MQPCFISSKSELFTQNTRGWGTPPRSKKQEKKRKEAKERMKPRLRSPEEVELFPTRSESSIFDVGEVLVAGGERGFASGREGGGEAIGVEQFVLGTEFGRAARQFEIGVADFQRELGNVFRDFHFDARSLGAPKDSRR